MKMKLLLVVFFLLTLLVLLWCHLTFILGDIQGHFNNLYWSVRTLRQHHTTADNIITQTFWIFVVVVVVINMSLFFCKEHQLSKQPCHPSIQIGFGNSLWTSYMWPTAHNSNGNNKNNNWNKSQSFSLWINWHVYVIKWLKVKLLLIQCRATWFFCWTG